MRDSVWNWFQYFSWIKCKDSSIFQTSTNSSRAFEPQSTGQSKWKVKLNLHFIFLRLAIFSSLRFLVFLSFGQNGEEYITESFAVTWCRVHFKIFKNYEVVIQYSAWTAFLLSTHKKRWRKKVLVKALFFPSLAIFKQYHGLSTSKTIVGQVSLFSIHFLLQLDLKYPL